MRRPILVATVLILVAACGDPVSFAVEDLVGSWSLTDSVQSVIHRVIIHDFHADGTYTTTVELRQVVGEPSPTQRSSITAGRFTTDRDHLTFWPDSVITRDGGGATTELLTARSSVPCTFRVTGDQLTLTCATDTGDTTVRLRRSD